MADTKKPTLAELYVQNFPRLYAMPRTWSEFYVMMAPYRELVMEHTGIDVEDNEGGDLEYNFRYTPFYMTYHRLCCNLNKPNVFLKSTKKARTSPEPESDAASQ